MKSHHAVGFQLLKGEDQELSCTVLSSLERSEQLTADTKRSTTTGPEPLEGRKLQEVLLTGEVHLLDDPEGFILESRPSTPAV